MMKNLLYKEFKLASHPTMFIFMSFGLMLLIPSYPYYVAFFYTMLAQFFVCIGGRENNDVFFTAMLPVEKKDVVKARLLMAGTVELATMLVSIPFAIIGMKINPYGFNQAGIEANPAFYGFVFIMFAVFNVIFFPGFYKTAYKAGIPFFKSTIVTAVFIVLAESLVWIPRVMSGVVLNNTQTLLPVEKTRSLIDTTDPAVMIKQLPILAAGMLIWIAVTVLAYRLAAKRFEKVDL